MSCVVEPLSSRGWTRAYILQLEQGYIDGTKDGSYYGNKKQFMKRHEAILKMLDNATNLAYEEGIRLPK